MPPPWRRRQGVRRIATAACCALLLLLLLVPASCSAAAADLVDGHYEATTLTRLAFGSCNKQWRNNTLWGHIVAFQPQAYLWLGDAVYVKEREGDNEANLRKAYTRQLASPGYKRLLATGAVVEGVYDDHDMSTNDGHRVVRAFAWCVAFVLLAFSLYIFYTTFPFTFITHIHTPSDPRRRQNYTPQRQAAYLDFLGHIPPDSPRRRRQGLYSAHVFGQGDREVKVLFLDVRSLSDDPALLFPGSNNAKAWIPLKPYWLALTRWLAVVLGYTERYAGDVLGEEQWAWLERQLAGSTAAAHVVVSSIQVHRAEEETERGRRAYHALTRFIQSKTQLPSFPPLPPTRQVLSTNPIVEGWQHYPRAQARLLALFNEHQPKGLVFLSGDVHFAELLSTDSEPREAFEVTSSGMTHTCFATAFGMCEMAVHRYRRHRLAPEAFYGGLNYGTMEFDWEGADGPWLTVSVRDRKGKARLEVSKPVGAAAAWNPLGAPYRMQDNHDLAFFLLAQLGVMCVVLALASLVMAIVRRRRERRRRRLQEKQAAGGANGKAAANGNGNGHAASAASAASAAAVASRRGAKARKAD